MAEDLLEPADGLGVGVDFRFELPEPAFDAGEAGFDVFEGALGLGQGHAAVLDGFRVAGELGGEQLGLGLGHDLGAVADLALPVQAAIGFEPHPSADDVALGFFEDASGLLEVDEEGGAKGVEGFDGLDAGGGGHGWDG